VIAEKPIIVEKIREGSLDPEKIEFYISEGATAGDILSKLDLQDFRLSCNFCFLDNSVDIFQLLSNDGVVLFASISPYTVIERKNEQGRSMVLA
jgi:hypothetical protein